MIDLRYSLVIEATLEPDFFSFYSPDLEGFTGVGHSVEDCVYQAKWSMNEHVHLLEEQNLPVPLPKTHYRALSSKTRCRSGELAELGAGRESGMDAGGLLALAGTS
jgi:predicted RNase H-like HicB family nuclease